MPSHAQPTGAIATARHPKLAAFIERSAIKRGRFVLASGRESSYYCDGKQVSFSGEGALLIADAVLQEISGLEADAIGGMDMGATPIVSVVAMRSVQVGRPLPSFVVRKDVKGHGTKKKVEGILPDKPSRVVMIDDVVTTGGSILQAVEVVRELGHDVVLVISVLDREAGGEQAMRAHGLPYRPLVTIGELGIANE